MSETKVNTHRGIPWMKTSPCATCGTTNEVCARPPGVVYDDNQPGRCDTCGHSKACHVW